MAKTVAEGIMQGLEGYARGRQVGQQDEERKLRQLQLGMQMREAGYGYDPQQGLYLTPEGEKQRAMSRQMNQAKYDRMMAENKFWENPQFGVMGATTPQAPSIEPVSPVSGSMDQETLPAPQATVAPDASNQPFVMVQTGFRQLKPMANPAYVSPEAKIKMQKETREQEKYKLKTIGEEEYKRAALRSNIDFLNQKLEDVEKVLEGKKYFGPFAGMPTSVASVIGGASYGPRIEWETRVNKLLGQQVLDKLGQLKAQSRTGASGMGALSEKELALLERSATALNKKLLPGQAEEILKQMQNSFNRSKLIFEADQAIQDGADPKMVKARLSEMGIG